MAAPGFHLGRGLEPRQTVGPEALEEAAQLLEAFGAQTIQAPRPIAPNRHQLGLLEHAQVLRDRRCREVKVGRDLARRQLVRLAEELEDAAPIGLGDGLKSSFHAQRLSRDLTKSKLHSIRAPSRNTPSRRVVVPASPRFRLDTSPMDAIVSACHPKVQKPVASRPASSRGRFLGQGAVTPRVPTGGARLFLQVIELELLPMVEAEYRACPGDRALLGHSAGGMFALYTLWQEPRSFRRFVVGSPPLGWGEEALFFLPLYHRHGT